MKYLIACLFISVSINLHGQTTIDLNKEPPFIPDLVKVFPDLKSGEIDTLDHSSEILRFEDGQQFKIRLRPNPKYDGPEQVIYFGIIDIQPDGKYSILTRHGKEEDSLNVGQGFLSQVYQVAPPFGTDVMIFIYSREPLNFMQILNKQKAITSENLLTGLTKEDIEWLLQGQPPEFLKNIHLKTLLFEIIDSKKQKGKKKKEPESDTSKFDRCADNAVQSSSCPLITIIEPLVLSNNARGVVPVSVNCQNYIIKGLITVKSNNPIVLINGSRADLKTVYAGKQFWWEKQVEIKKGENKIFIEAQANDSSYTKKEFVFLQNQDYKSTDSIVGLLQSKNYLVLVGINSYDNWPDLRSPTIDIKDLKNCLLSKYKFDEEFTFVLENEKATFKNIDNLFRALSEKVTEIDNVIVYFAGHGAFDKAFEEGYWVPVEGELSDYTTLIPNERVRKWMQRLKAKHTLFIADACFSGSYYTGERGVSPYTDRITKLNSRWIFTSGREEAVADRLFGTENSPFAYYLIKFLNENESDQLLISDLANLVSKAVSNNSDQTPLAAPIKNAGDEGGQFSFGIKK